MYALYCMNVSISNGKVKATLILSLTLGNFDSSPGTVPGHSAPSSPAAVTPVPHVGVHADPRH